MKSIVLVALGVLLGVGLMLFVPHGAPQVVYAGTPSGNGDVNGDGRVDIADGIYIINYQLRGGPPPVAIECIGSSLPATGQTACYGYVAEQGWVEVPCDSAEYPGQDGFYQASCPSAGRFTDNGDGTVTDNCTGLVWQKDTADVNGDGQISDVWDGGDVVTWQAALQYCEGLEFAGRSDWRLPNVRELQSIVDYGRFDPSIDPVFGAESGWYWSSSTYVSLPGGAWVVYFLDSIVLVGDDEGSHIFVRAVRG